MKQKDELIKNNELPYEVELGRDFKFHNIFICPVTKEISMKDNPPMLLTCGHVISKTALSKMSKGAARTKFKCPTCPTEMTTENVRELKIFRHQFVNS